MSARGFTIFELLATLAILVLLLVIGVPLLSKQVQNTRVKAATQELFHSVQQARTLAVSHNRRATIAHKGRWQDGWELFYDRNNNGYRDDSESPIFEAPRLSEVKIYPNDHVQNYISFVGTGEGKKAGTSNSGTAQIGTLRICPEELGEGYKLVLSWGGRMRIERIPSTECMAP